MASLSSRLINHLNIQTIYNDSHMAKFIAENPNLTKDEINDIIKKSQNINLHKNVVIIVKTLAKQSCTTAKEFMTQIPMLSNIAALMEPNNIEITVTADEYKAFLQYADRTPGKIAKQLNHPLLIVPKNILCSLFFSSLSNYGGGPSKDDIKISCERAVNRIYQEYTNNNNDDYVDVQPLTRKRPISISSSISSIDDYDPHKKIKLEPVSDDDDDDDEDPEEILPIQDQSHDNDEIQNAQYHIEDSPLSTHQLSNISFGVQPSFEAPPFDTTEQQPHTIENLTSFETNGIDIEPPDNITPFDSILSDLDHLFN